MTFGSLFSGIGGLDLGLERAGMKCMWQVEREEYARRVLAKHWPNVARWDNVETFPPADTYGFGGTRWCQITERQAQGGAAYWFCCDLIAGGFPCQPVSLAGRREAQRDPRWLWPHFARVVRVLRPRYILVENTPGLFTAGMGDVLGDLSQMGFDAEWITFPASAVGAPHLRERVFVVAYASSMQGGERHQPKGERGRQKEAEQTRLGGEHDSNANGISPQARIFRPGREIAALPHPCWGTDKPGVARALNGVPNRVERIEGIGNAVVPQVAEWIGRRIMEYEQGA